MSGRPFRTIQIGLAQKFSWDFAGEVPLILKLNGKTDIPPDDEALSPVHASLEEPCSSAQRCGTGRPGGAEPREEVAEVGHG
ncbi:hypothetical protein [Pseudonocardia zijingensis]|uniref:hypothetical protein n=1 Tax=Pseudonocardia zijingensis TaxID=153376 RepID=UPI0031D74F90